LRTVATSCYCLALSPYVAITLEFEALLQTTLSFVPLTLEQLAPGLRGCSCLHLPVTTDDANLMAAFLVSQPTYLMSALGVNGWLSYRILSRISSNLSISIVPVRMPCARAPYIGLRTYAPLPTRETQSSTNLPRARVF
jgi:hypothetical protein